jgi:hypothetical protein
VTQRNHDRAYLANLGDDHFTGIGEVVGVTDMEYFAMTFRIADSSDVFRARCPIDAGLASATGFGRFALRLHRRSRFAGQKRRILVMPSYRTNIAKVIKRLRFEKQWLSKPLFCTNNFISMFCKEV